MYGADTFFHLTVIGRVGLVALSIVLAGLAMVVLHAMTAGRPLWIRLIWAACVYIAFLWASPQVYYEYYRMIMSGLPAQIVIRWPPPAIDAVALLGFNGPVSLSAHARGVLGWVLFANALWFGR